MKKQLLLLVMLLLPIVASALDLISDFEWLEANNNVEVVIGEPYQLKFSCSDNSLPFTSGYADSWVHYDFAGGQHVVSSPTGYSIDDNGIITGLQAGSYAIKFTGWIQAKSGADKWLYITVVTERKEKESNNTLNTANEITNKIRFGLYNTSDIDYFRYTNDNLKWGDKVTFKIHYYGTRENPFGYKWSTFSGTSMSGSGSLISQDQECTALVTSGNTVYLEVYYDQSRSQYFNYGEEFEAEVYINGIPVGGVKKCATPTIRYDNKRLIFDCDTEGVEYVSEIKVADIGKYNDSEVALSATYEISVYATKNGYEDSDVATATLVWTGATFTETIPSPTPDDPTMGPATETGNIYDWNEKVGTISVVTSGQADGIAESAVKVNDASVNCIKFGKSATYTDDAKTTIGDFFVSITPADGGFKAGDVVHITGCINNKDTETKNGAVNIYSSLEAASLIKTTENFANTYDTSVSPVEQTIMIPADCESLILTRSGNTATCILALTVVRGEVLSETSINLAKDDAKAQKVQKRMEKGSILIVKGDNTFNASGTRVK